MRHRAFRPFSRITAIKLSIFISIILNAIMLLGYAYNSRLDVSLVFKLIYMFLTDILLFYLLYIFIFRIIQLRSKKHVKLLYAISGLLAITVVLSITLTEGEFLLLPDSPFPPGLQITMNLVKDLIILIIVSLSTSLLYSINQRQLTLFENEILIADNIRIRYEALKNQLDPHFLFNSLNTLDGLIGNDDEKAHEYVQNLSQVFRYTIGNKEITHLNDELDFTGSYAQLMKKIRYGDNLQIQYNIDEKYRNYFIVPVSLQLLVENAIKHNVISSRHPLLITIETTPHDTIRVLNAIQPKSGVEHDEGIGLAYLTERYEILFQKEVVIKKTDVFCVEIPLIKQQTDNTIKNPKLK
ncbi:MAG: histidine kinase [Bacteroidia bacterium]|nr:histidine kinase [Bacteroidia bacterium]